jgi:uncharacterized protein YoaH (UPF0181 family)
MNNMGGIGFDPHYMFQELIQRGLSFHEAKRMVDKEMRAMMKGYDQTYFEFKVEVKIDEDESWIEYESPWENAGEISISIPKRYLTDDFILRVLFGEVPQLLERGIETQCKAIVIVRKEKHVRYKTEHVVEKYKDTLLTIKDLEVMFKDEQQEEDSADEASEQGSGPGECSEDRGLSPIEEGTSAS